MLDSGNAASHGVFRKTELTITHDKDAKFDIIASVPLWNGTVGNKCTLLFDVIRKVPEGTSHHQHTLCDGANESV